MVVLATLRLVTAIAINSVILAAQAALTFFDLFMLTVTFWEWHQKSFDYQTGRKHFLPSVTAGYTLAGLQAFCGGTGILFAAAPLPGAAFAGKTFFLVLGTSLFLGAALERRLAVYRQKKDSMARSALMHSLRRDLYFQALVLITATLNRGGLCWPETMLLPLLGVFAVRLGLEAFSCALGFPEGDRDERLQRVVQEVLPRPEGVTVAVTRCYCYRGRLYLDLVVGLSTVVDRTVRKHMARLVRSALKTRYSELDRVIVFFRRAQ